jgi:NADH-quinone oxidoreductase subunit H
VAGYHTEYAAMKFALFFLGEYTAMIAGCSVIVALFLGGCDLPFLPINTAESSTHLFGILVGLIHIGIFFAKVSALLIFFIWVRWTLPRFRFDQLMRLGWLYLFEIALVNIFLTAGLLAFMH